MEGRGDRINMSVTVSKVWWTGRENKDIFKAKGIPENGGDGGVERIVRGKEKVYGRSI